MESLVARLRMSNPVMAVPASLSTFWRDKRVLITGHTGFKGSWLIAALRELGAVCAGYGLAPEKNGSLYYQSQVNSFLSLETLADVCDYRALSDAISSFSPQIVFHMAAQSLVKEGFNAPYRTFATNTLGTLNVIECLRRQSDVNVVVVVTTDKVYRIDRAQQQYHQEDATLWASDPYGASKVAAELIAQSYQCSVSQNQDCKILIARAGNVIGGGDWAENRLIPDVIRALNAGQRTLEVRYPKATRPWQHVLEPLIGYLIYAQAACCGSPVPPALNFGPSRDDAISVEELVQIAVTHWGAETLLELKQTTEKLDPETPHLSIDCSLASRSIGVNPIYSVYEAVEKTVDWYKKFLNGADAKHLMIQDIHHFLNRCEQAQSEPVTACTDHSSSV